MMPVNRLSALGQHKHGPTTDHAGLVTHTDLLVHARPRRNAGSQVVLVLFDPSSLIHLAPIPAMTCFPSFTAKSPFPGHPHRDYYLSCLSWTVTISPVYSGSIFLPRSFITSTLSIQSLAYFLFFQLTLQLPGRIFGYSLPFICLLAISPALPTSQIYPWPCL